MTTSKSLSEFNLAELNLVQALLGAVSPNFRMVTLSEDDGMWKFVFVLEHEDADDREEILDVVSEFDALQSGPVEREVVITADSGPLEWPDPPARVVYRRRE